MPHAGILMADSDMFLVLVFVLLHDSELILSTTWPHGEGYHCFITWKLSKQTIVQL